MTEMITVGGKCVPDNVDGVISGLGYPVPGQYGMTLLESVIGSGGSYQITESVLLMGENDFYRESITSAFAFPACSESWVSPEFIALQIVCFGVGLLCGMHR